jgi:hypothetical protein
MVWGQVGKKVRPYLKNNQSKKGWEYDSSSRMPAWQIPVTTQKQTNKKTSLGPIGYIKSQELDIPLDILVVSSLQNLEIFGANMALQLNE